MSNLPTADDVLEAAERLSGWAVHTPLIRNDALDDQIGLSVFLKLENLQRTGTFKFRGAFNRLSQLTAAERRAGVVAFSSGNHAQGVAAAAGLLEIPASIVMPSDAPDVKIENTRTLGAEVICYDRLTESREEIAADLARSKGCVLVPSFDDFDVIAGQGTVGLELMRQLEDRGVRPDAVLVCCGGGGLTAGSALAIRHLSPETEVYTVEPEGFDDTARSLASGHRVANENAGGSFCDALLAPQPGEMTFAINRQLVAAGLVVSDDEVVAAIAFAFRHLKIVLEPGGAVALAAVLANRVPSGRLTVGVVCSGGNVDASTFRKCI